MLTACSQRELLQGLDERQANEVVAVLLHHNLEASKRHQGKAGFVVEVAPQDLPDAIELVQRQNLPSKPRTQIAAQFPVDAMVSTPFGERARLLSAIEQRLEESMEKLEGVQAARVHLSYDASPGDADLQRRAPPVMHVAALLVHMPGRDEQALLQSAKRFLRNAFADVSYENVSVVLSPAAPVNTFVVTKPARGGRWLPGVAILSALLALAAATLFVVRRKKHAD